MSVYCIVNARQKLHDPTRKIFLNEPLQYDNSQAHCFRLNLTGDDGTSPADLSNVSVVANFMRPDGGTVEITTGTITGNVVEVILPAACYAAVGRYKLTVNLVEGSGESAAARTALIVEGITERNTSGTPVDPGTIMPSINDLIAEIETVRDSIPADYSELSDTVDDLADNEAQDFSTEAYYAPYSVVRKDGKLYIRTASTVGHGAWVAADWDETTLTGAMQDKEDRIYLAMDGIASDISSEIANKAVRYDEDQELTDTQKKKARENIWALGNRTLGLPLNTVSSLQPGDYCYDPTSGAIDIVPEPGSPTRSIGLWAYINNRDAGSVRLDEAQTLTDAQKATARGNIEAASLVVSQGATSISQATQGGTTYDVQDTAAREMASEAKGALNLVDFAQQNTEQTATASGLTFTRRGNRVTVNGTCTAAAESLARVRMGGAIAAIASGKPSAAQNNAAYGAALNANRVYRVVTKLISGTVVDGTMGSYYTTPYRAGTNTSVVNINTTYDDVRTREGLTGETGLVLWLSIYGGTVCTNAVFEVTMEDVTLSSESAPSAAQNISGATVTITAVAGVRYVCSATQVTSMTFTPSAYGICSVRFRSGTTPTVLNIPQTVRMPDGWFGIEANTTYKITIEDGVWADVTAWHEDASSN